MADKVLDVRHVVDSMVSPEGLQAGGGGDAYTKEECDERFAPKVTQIIKAPLIQANTSGTAYEPGDITFEKLNAKFDDCAGHQWPVFKFFAQCNFAAGNYVHSFYFNLPSGYRLPVVNDAHDQLYLEGLNVTVQYNQGGSGGRGFACLSNAQYHSGWNGCDALVVTHAANNDVATDTQIKVTLDRGGSSQALTEPFIVNVEFALALEEVE